ncbi:MAG: SDR family NAD(P)-dependent oxidoreductase [Candidatus Hydrogenedentes bacterium]|nr:SDR family NAD(P)-dependent oxidoreductase [Candidatus Hydrogenedentota bacterium]
MFTLTQTYPKKRAFITGAGSGLGAALCHHLARDGWTIGMAEMREEPLQEQCAKVAALGGKPIPILLDVTDRARYAKVVEDFLAEQGGVDLVVNNAGVAGSGDVGEYSLEDWDWLMSINFTGVLHGCHFFAGPLKRQRSGHIINIASAAALAPVPKLSAYCCAKVGVKMLTECMYNEMHAFGVRMTVVMPEFFQTKLYERTRGQDQAQTRRILERSKYTAEDVARVVLTQAGEGRLHVAYPLSTLIMNYVRRFFPMTFIHLVRKESLKREAVAAAEVAKQART